MCNCFIQCSNPLWPVKIGNNVALYQFGKKINLDPGSDSSHHLLPKCFPSSDYEETEKETIVAARKLGWVGGREGGDLKPPEN